MFHPAPGVRLGEGEDACRLARRADTGDGVGDHGLHLGMRGIAQMAMTGREIVEYARPLPAATNAVIQGTRDGRPFSRYVTMQELQTATMSDQDTVTFITDAPARTIRVTIEGSRIGPSVLVADRDTQLCNLLDYVAVDP